MKLDITYPPQLPVSEKRVEIANAIQHNQVVVIAGETGSGKTTQIPKICLELGYGIDGLIGHTQPRRLAARAVASRIAEELNLPLGQGVGYQVRFSDKTSASTHIKLMTDGILLAEIQQDRLLKKYQVIIIDEAHERSLNIDFLLGYLKRLCRQRRDLKIIITSATIDVEKFSEHFSDAPIISVSGRTFPVELIYQDPAELDSDSKDDDVLYSGVVKALRTIDAIERDRRQAPGDVLVFLSGERDIRELAQALRKLELRQTEILPLYARLTQNEQQRIFAPHRGRRIILSTNVAETSLTVPGIRYVIDSGMARISRYSVQSKVQRLPIEPVSQASANQRAGRCGRVASGICIRLYSEADYLSRPLFTDPEIQRTNLSAVILQMLLLKLGEIDRFPFIEPPDRRAINDGYRLLDELGAIDKDRRLTPLGRAMASLPADPRLSRMLLESVKRNSLYEMLIIVSALSAQDPRDTPADKRQVARERHQQFAHPESDFLSWVTLWQEVELQRQELSQSQFRKYCKDNFLSWLRLREWRETHRQLMLACQSLGHRHSHSLPAQETDADYKPDYESIHRSMLPGSLNQIGQKGTDGLYTGSRGRRFALFPSSVLARKSPKWIMSAELIETSRLFATLAARIEPEWVVDAASHLLRREYFEAHWEKKRGEVVAFERVSLFGLVLIEKRRVSFAGIDSVKARDLFIREALVGGELQTNAPFYRHNIELIADVRRQEEKERRPDILVSEDQLADFYNQRLPENICTAAALERWSRKQPDPKSTVLHMRLEDVSARDVDASSQRNFPDKTLVQRNQLQVDYRFSPGSDDDGVSIEVPAALLAQMGQQDLDWAVPGLLQERCVALIRSLPKALRKQFVPVPEFVSKALSDVTETRPQLTRLLTEQAWRQKRVQIPTDAWDDDAVPAHLRPFLKVVDNNGRELAKGQNLTALKEQFISQAANSDRAKGSELAVHPLEQKNLKDWRIAELPEQVEIERGVKLLRFPALQDAGDSVDVVLCDTRALADRLNERGLARLYMLRTPQQKNLILDMLKAVQKKLGLKLIAHGHAWLEASLLTVYRLSFDVSAKRRRNRDEFEQQLTRGKSDLMNVAGRLCRLLEESYSINYDIRQLLAPLAKRFPDAAADITNQLNALFADNFPESVPADWLREYPRYLKGIHTRLEKLPGQVEKDRQLGNSVKKLENSWQGLHDAMPEALPEFPWLLQELRVSFFAQNLGTRGPVSEKRLMRMLEHTRAGDIHKGPNLG